MAAETPSQGHAAPSQELEPPEDRQGKEAFSPGALGKTAGLSTP